MSDTTTTCPHDCGLCDQPVVFDGRTRDGTATFVCPSCRWWHVATDCCEAETAEPWLCSWTIELTGDRLPEEIDFPSDMYGPCRAPVTAIMRDGVEVGWQCEAGHSHVSHEVREAEGWDYYDDEEIERIRGGQQSPRTPQVRDMVGRQVWT